MDSGSGRNGKRPVSVKSVLGTVSNRHCDEALYFNKQEGRKPIRLSERPNEN